MESDKIKEMLASALGDCDIEVDITGNKLVLRLVSDIFEGLSQVKRQKKVYAILNDMVTSGEVHAVTMYTSTPREIGR
ncbi:MAG: BolA family protein [Candidatus Azotimanducaceae bacterium]|uniref:BolA/IbaG family iron-sulfur metabolism protein n=1 Tax=OM182 bacterium TaxID=2510334 RepID=A0A520S4W4_9GAMM|nr:cell division protein BolA [Gammaproteobacteria bacterium]OUV67554.1 MAG: hypothetical protein CBC93_04595 [Gammaproteobacteria bacterium TMED133]RZO77527.1 MAG: BolA/IbaG family iron-sulfur metabolism protein [OM182 bacterium]